MYLPNTLQKCEVENLVKRLWALTPTNIERWQAQGSIVLTQASSLNTVYIWDYYNGTITTAGGTLLTKYGNPLFFGMVSYAIWNRDNAANVVAGAQVRLKNWYIRELLPATSDYSLNLDVVQYWGDGANFNGDPFPANGIVERKSYSNTGLNILNTGMQIEIQTDATGSIPINHALFLTFQGWKINFS